MQLQCAILCLGISFVFALRRIDMMEDKTDINIGQQIFDNDCRQELCDLIMSIDNDKIIYYLIGFIKAIIE